MRFIATALLVFLSSGCAVTIKMPANRYDSPETMGKQWRAKVATGLGGANNVILTPDFTTMAPNPQSPTFDTATEFQLRAGVAALENLDIEIKTLTALQIKYQFLGDGRLYAQPGNFSMAATLAGGWNESQQNGTQLFGSSQRYEVKLKEGTFDGALIFGYRVNELFLMYGGPFFTLDSYTGTDSPLDGNNVAISITNFSGSVFQTGANLGLEFGIPIVQGRVELAYANVNSGDLNTGRVYIGGQVAVNLGKTGERPKND